MLTPIGNASLKMAVGNASCKMAASTCRAHDVARLETQVLVGIFFAS